MSRANPYAYHAMMRNLSIQHSQWDKVKELEPYYKKYLEFEAQTREIDMQEAKRQQAASQQAASQQALVQQQQQALVQQQAAAQPQQQALAQQQAAAQQQQQQYKHDTEYPQVQGAPSLGGWFGGGRKHKSPRRKNKTRKSRKARRLYKSRKRHR